MRRIRLPRAGALGWLLRHRWTASVAQLGAVLLIETLVGLVLVLAGLDPASVLGPLNAISAPFVVLVIVMSAIRAASGITRFSDGDDPTTSPGAMVIGAMTAKQPDDRS